MSATTAKIQAQLNKLNQAKHNFEDSTELNRDVMIDAYILEAKELEKLSAEFSTQLQKRFSR